MEFFRKYYFGYILSKCCLDCNSGDLDVTLNDFENFYLDLVIGALKH